MTNVIAAGYPTRRRTGRHHLPAEGVSGERGSVRSALREELLLQPHLAGLMGGAKAAGLALAGRKGKGGASAAPLY